MVLLRLAVCCHCRKALVVEFSKHEHVGLKFYSSNSIQRTRTWYSYSSCTAVRVQKESYCCCTAVRIMMYSSTVVHALRSTLAVNITQYTDNTGYLRYKQYLPYVRTAVLVLLFYIYTSDMLANRYVQVYEVDSVHTRTCVLPYCCILMHTRRAVDSRPLIH